MIDAKDLTTEQKIAGIKKDELKPRIRVYFRENEVLCYPVIFGGQHVIGAALHKPDIYVLFMKHFYPTK